MRINLKELTPRRMFEGAARRVANVPDSLVWRFGSAGRRNRSLLDAFRNRHQGERCFILANGPSLAKMDLSPLENEVTIGMNRIYLHFDKMTFTPTYYACINELVLEQFTDDIAKLPMPKFLNWNRRHLFTEADHTTFLNLKLAVNEKFSTDLTRFAYSGGTVTLAAMQIAYFMGVREAYVIGLDHNFVEKGIPSKTEVRVQDRDESHFHPDYFPKGTLWQLPDLPRSEIAFGHARRAYEADGRQVLDATVDGHCQVFEKVEYRSLIERGR